jgi:hypothetical protein
VDEQKAAETRANEPDLLAGLLAAGTDKQSRTAKVTIKRGSQEFFSFRIRPLTESEYKSASNKATPVDSKGNPDPNKRDESLMRNILIYTATAPEDRTKLWDNQAALSQFNVLSGMDVVDKVLLAGEKQAVIFKIDEISGFGTDLEETAKN